MHTTRVTSVAAFALALLLSGTARAGADPISCEELDGYPLRVCQNYCDDDKGDCEGAQNWGADNCQWLLDKFMQITGGTPDCDGEPEPEPKCGDGEVNQPTEECDDGNNNPGDGCSPDCQEEDEPEPSCGDGIVNQPWEECDDGNDDNSDGCDEECQRNGFCGDGYVDEDEGEECDPGRRPRCRWECDPWDKNGECDPWVKTTDPNGPRNDECEPHCEWVCDPWDKNGECDRECECDAFAKGCDCDPLQKTADCEPHCDCDPWVKDGQICDCDPLDKDCRSRCECDPWAKDSPDCKPRECDGHGHHRRKHQSEKVCNDECQLQQRCPNEKMLIHKVQIDRNGQDYFRIYGDFREDDHCHVEIKGHDAPMTMDQASNGVLGCYTDSLEPGAYLLWMTCHLKDEYWQYCKEREVEGDAFITIVPYQQ